MAGNTTRYSPVLQAGRTSQDKGLQTYLQQRRSQTKHRKKHVNMGRSRGGLRSPATPANLQKRCPEDWQRRRSIVLHRYWLKKRSTHQTERALNGRSVYQPVAAACASGATCMTVRRDSLFFCQRGVLSTISPFVQFRCWTSG